MVNNNSIASDVDADAMFAQFVDGMEKAVSCNRECDMYQIYLRKVYLPIAPAKIDISFKNQIRLLIS